MGTARKLAAIIYGLLTNQEMYEDDLMVKPKTIKVPAHKKLISNNRINFEDKFVDMIQDVMHKPVRELSLITPTQQKKEIPEERNPDIS